MILKIYDAISLTAPEEKQFELQDYTPTTIETLMDDIQI